MIDTNGDGIITKVEFNNFVAHLRTLKLEAEALRGSHKTLDFRQSRPRAGSRTASRFGGFDTSAMLDNSDTLDRA